MEQRSEQIGCLTVMRSLPLLLLLPFTAAAQVFEHVDQRTESVRYGRTIAIGGGRLVTAGGANTDGGISVPPFFFTAYGPDGMPVWERTIYYTGGMGHWWSGDLITLPDSGFLAVGSADWCDVVTGTSVIGRYDMEGTPLWEIEVHSTPGEGDYIGVLARSPGAEFAAASTGSIHRFNWNGEHIGQFAAPEEPITGLHWYHDSLLLVLSPRNLFVVDTTGLPLDTFPLPGTSTDLRMLGDRAFVLMDEGLARIDMEDGTMELVATNDDGALAFVESPAHRLLLHSSDTLHEVFADGPLQAVTAIGSVPGLAITGAAVRDGALFVSGNTLIEERSSAVRRGQALTGGHAVHDDDIELLVTADTTWFVASLTPPGNIYDQLANLTAHVVNHGSHTLNELVLSFRTPHAWSFCGTHAQTLIVNNLGIATGDTAHIAFNNLLYNYGPSAPGNSTTATLCLAALAPNLLADRSPTDNHACTDVLFVNTVGLAERGSMQVITAYPNPFTDRITLTGLPTGPLRFELFDATGRSVFNTNSSATNYHTLDLHGLNTGIYHLLIQSTHNRWTEKVVKADP